MYTIRVNTIQLIMVNFLIGCLIMCLDTCGESDVSCVNRLMIIDLAVVVVS